MAAAESAFGPEFIRDRFRGAIVGLAVGDALGATVEFAPRGSFKPPTDLVGGGPFKLKPGEWTDDTSQALCLADSLIAYCAFNADDCMKRLYRWMRTGDPSPSRRCFDIGPSTTLSLREFARTGDPYQGRSDRDTNGALMRLAPVPLAHADDTISALLAAELATKLTHGGADTLAASRYLAGMLVGAVRGENPFRANTPEGLYCPPGAYHDEHAGAYGTSLTPAVIAAARGEHAGPRAGFSAIECFDAALWAVRSARNFEDAVTRAVALGEDADTVGAVAGQLAGAIWGHRSIPARWTAAVAWHDRLVTTADALLSTSGLLTAVRTTTGKGVPL